MSRRRRRARADAGTAPGTLRANAEHPAPVVNVMAYSAERLVERRIGDLTELEKLGSGWNVIWVDVQGLGDTGLIERLGRHFGFHPLALEDVTHTRQRPKAERYGEHLYVVARMPESDPDLESEQFSVFLRPGVLVTFQERVGDCYEPVRQRIRDGRQRIRAGGPDYLMYALLDALVDSYFVVLETLGDALDALQTDTLTRPTRETLSQIQEVRARLRSLRHDAWPLRDMLGSLAHDESVTPETRLYLRDCHDHTVLVIDQLETAREMASNLVELYMSALSNRMNEVMKVLTMISTIFIPLSFIAGVYGMNFDPDTSPWNLPELRWAYGYPFALFLMALLSGGMLLYFKRKGWFD